MISFHDQRTAPHCHYSNNSHSPQRSKLAQLGGPLLCVSVWYNYSVHILIAYYLHLNIDS